ncbi:hypothetical protein BDB00DRAFT_574253 [Zychaea mexicana]|uniref:uncharacterized protein n=1 Tax=Zychaea mexicana TaxID=64656 RepID=UPI0022FEC059|nr:uncharacterized protein BDB00DRAFT_574253 [Zychaea mexicana]KAI9489948.1 hypothetical protein BDB00DRAFT_574253 [Zychaea mexicana]
MIAILFVQSQFTGCVGRRRRHYRDFVRNINKYDVMVFTKLLLTSCYCWCYYCKRHLLADVCVLDWVMSNVVVVMVLLLRPRRSGTSHAAFALSGSNGVAYCYYYRCCNYYVGIAVVELMVAMVDGKKEPMLEAWLLEANQIQLSAVLDGVVSYNKSRHRCVAYSPGLLTIEKKPGAWDTASYDRDTQTLPVHPSLKKEKAKVRYCYCNRHRTYTHTHTSTLLPHRTLICIYQSLAMGSDRFFHQQQQQQQQQ